MMQSVLIAQQVGLQGRLAPFCFSVSQGEIVHFIGPNGSGKSTALSLLSGLVEGAGQVTMKGQLLNEVDLPTLARWRSYLSQQDKPAFSIAVHHYLSLSLSALPNAKVDDIETAVRFISNTLSITDKWSRDIQHLSGGEWQRVRLAAACLQVWPSLNPDAKLLLLDEPAAALDVGQEAAMYQLIRHVAAQGITIIMANHDLSRTLREADTVLLFDQGKCIAQGETDIVMETTRLESVFTTKIRRFEVDGQAGLFFID